MPCSYDFLLSVIESRRMNRRIGAKEIKMWLSESSSALRIGDRSAKQQDFYRVKQDNFRTAYIRLLLTKMPTGNLKAASLNKAKT